MGPFSVVHRVRDLKITLTRVLLCCFAHQVLKGPPKLCCFSSLLLICAEREAAEMVPSSVCDSAVSPCLQVSRLSFISISHCTLLCQVPSHHLPSVNCRPCPRTAFQSLFQLQAAALSRGLASLSGMCVAVARIDSLHSDSHRSAVSLSSSLNASPLSQMFPSHAALFLLQFPNPRCRPSSSHSSCFALLPLSY